MSSAGEDESDAVLSDVEADGEPVHASFAAASVGDVSMERFRELLAELDCEKKARLAAESSKNDLQVSFNRLKTLALEAIKKRDDSNRSNEEASRELERLTNELAEANRSREEFEEAAQMLISGIEKISGKAKHIKDFSAGELPRSQKYTGLAAVAYGVIKRTNEIVEELLKQIDSTTKSRNDRNYEIAIEVSQLEATIDQLKEEVSKKTGKLSDIEGELSEKKKLVESQRPLLVEQLNLVCRVHHQLYNVIKIVDVNDSEISEALFLPQETGLEEIVRATLAGMESMHELSRIVVAKARDAAEEKNLEVKRLNGVVSQLVREKEHVGVLLRSALSKANKLFQVAENGLRDAKIDFKESVQETEEEEIYALVGALENIIKASQVEIVELHHTLDKLRAESSVLEEHLEAQAKELTQKKLRIEELEEKERAANENVEGLMMDIAAAEEEITRWKVAAEQEAAAGGAIEHDYLAQISALKQEIEEAKQTMIELERKLKFKEETAAAAMEARFAADNSLRLADMRSSRLRDRVEELSHQLEEVNTRDDTHQSRNRPRYVCWPWEWLGVDFAGLKQIEPPLQQHGSDEMELSEPLI